MPPLLPLAAIIFTLVGHPVPVHCANLNGPLGETIVVNHQPQQIILDNYICNEWQQVKFNPVTQQDMVDDENAGQALLAAVHEAEHWRYKDDDEARTECRAMRDFRQTVWFDVILGEELPLNYAANLMPLLDDGALKADAKAPPQYHGGTC